MDFSHTPIIELARIIAEHLQDQGIEVVLVGGLAVEIYTENIYLTKDIDVVNTNYASSRHLNTAMAQLGFAKKGRIYVNPTTDITVEFPTGPLSVGDELITRVTVAQLATGQIPILQVSDIVKDRLAAYFHWRDRQSLVQALAILVKHPLKI
ncbi:MAG TPA: nucleotidyltransferase, partial [Cellvibrionaceae bacterium]|nr:nucleotidyltransferase [Cellvibrionaceae bacterium]